MKPVSFPGQNIVFGANQPEYQPLPALALGDKQGTVITCWELTPEEREHFLKEGKIYLSMFTFYQPLQPVLLATDLSMLAESNAGYDAQK